MIFLQILKIIGIVLACAAGLVVLAALLLLFVPITYKIYADGEGTAVSAGAVLKVIFGFAVAKVSYADKKAAYCIRVAGIKIKKGDIDLQGKEKEPAAKEKQEKTEFDEKPDKDSEYIFKESSSAKDSGAGKDEDDERSERNASSACEGGSGGENDDASSGGRIQAVIDRLNDLKEKYETVRYITDAPVTKRAFAAVKRAVADLLGHIRPRTMKGHVIFGMEDPSATALIYGAAGSICKMIDQRLILEPDLENKTIKINNLQIKGRIIAGYVLLLAAKIWFNRDVKRVIGYIRRKFNG